MAVNAAAIAAGLYIYYLSPPLAELALGLSVFAFWFLAVVRFLKKPTVKIALYWLLPSALLFLLFEFRSADSMISDFSVGIEYAIRRPQFMEEASRLNAQSVGYMRWDRWNANAFNANAFYFIQVDPMEKGAPSIRLPCQGRLKRVDADFYVCSDYFD